MDGRKEAILFLVRQTWETFPTLQFGQILHTLDIVGEKQDIYHKTDKEILEIMNTAYQNLT